MSWEGLRCVNGQVCSIGPGGLQVLKNNMEMARVRFNPEGNKEITPWWCFASRVWYYGLISKSHLKENLCQTMKFETWTMKISVGGNECEKFSVGHSQSHVGNTVPQRAVIGWLQSSEVFARIPKLSYVWPCCSELCFPTPKYTLVIISQKYS